MKISALKEQIKNPDRVNVFVDGSYSFSLTISEVLDAKIRVGNELNQQDVEAFKKLSSDGKIKARSYEWLLNRPHSTREFQDYLRKKRVEPEFVERLVAYFTEKNVLSDERFSEWFTERAVRKHKSVRQTQNGLRSKGVSVQSHKVLSDDKAALRELIEKHSGKSRYADQARFIRYLQGKGFSYADIKEALMLREPEQGEVL